MPRPGIEPIICRSRVQDLTTTPPSHQYLLVTCCCWPGDRKSIRHVKYLHQQFQKAHFCTIQPNPKLYLAEQHTTVAAVNTNTL